MAVPKKRSTNSAKGQRRSHHALEASNSRPCPNCGKAAPSHRACAHCGFYKGKQVVKV